MIQLMISTVCSDFKFCQLIGIFRKKANKNHVLQTNFNIFLH